MRVRTLRQLAAVLSVLGDPEVADALRNELLYQSCHDEVYPHPWLCGECPYMNVGPICTKCGAGIEDARLLTPPARRPDLDAGRLQATV